MKQISVSKVNQRLQPKLTEINFRKKKICNSCSNVDVHLLKEFENYYMHPTKGKYPILKSKYCPGCHNLEIWPQPSCISALVFMSQSQIGLFLKWKVT